MARAGRGDTLTWARSKAPRLDILLVTRRQEPGTVWLPAGPGKAERAGLGTVFLPWGCRNN